MRAEGAVGGQQVPLFGVEEEDEPQDDGEQRAVHLVGIVGEGFPQQCSVAAVVRRLEAAQQFVQGVKHLFGQALADLVLPGAAVGKQGGQPLRARQREKALLAQQQPKRGGQRAAGRRQHGRNREVHPARALAARRGDETNGAAVEQQARRNPGRPQHALHPVVGREVEPAGPGPGAVEVPAGVEHQHQKLPRPVAVARVPLGDGVVRLQRLAHVG